MALVIKNLPANAGDISDMGSISGLGRSPWGRAWQHTPGFLPGESRGQGSLTGYSSIRSQRVRHNWSNLSCGTQMTSGSSCPAGWENNPQKNSNIQTLDWGKTLVACTASLEYGEEGCDFNLQLENVLRPSLGALNQGLDKKGMTESKMQHDLWPPQLCQQKCPITG